MKKASLVMSIALLAVPPAAAASSHYWSKDEAAVILDKTIELELAPSLEGLAEGERIALSHLLEAGRLMHELYLEQTHHQALDARKMLEALATREPQQAEALGKLFHVFKGPIATRPDNTRTPFLPVDALRPGKNVYPLDATRAELDAWRSRHGDDALLDPMTVVRRATTANARADLALLFSHPLLETLHPGLRERLETVLKTPQPQGFYAIPYALAYIERLMPVYRHLLAASEAVRPHDADFADYLALRARDLLANDYEAGDAAWVSGSFSRLNAQIGSYETYDDELYGVKSFFSASVLLKDVEQSAALARAIADIQALENSLPYSRHKKVRTDIPVGVYDVIADFGQARGTNTASILPNDADHARKYGRIILMRRNILTSEELFRDTRAAWQAALAPAFHQHLDMEAGFQRTLWHEIGHYLGVDRDERGRTLDVALQEYSDLYEEMKADLVALYVAPELRKSGYYDDAGLRALYADGIRRTLQQVKPRRDQPYQTMQLMQMNWFLDKGALRFANGKLIINHDRYHDAVASLLREVLAIQSAGDPRRAAAFVERWARWDENLHGVIAASIRDAVRYRYRLVRYAALPETGRD